VICAESSCWRRCSLNSLAFSLVGGSHLKLGILARRAEVLHFYISKPQRTPLLQWVSEQPPKNQGGLNIGCDLDSDSHTQVFLGGKCGWCWRGKPRVVTLKEL
jgi:hypothetical protein